MRHLWYDLAVNSRSVHDKQESARDRVFAWGGGAIILGAIPVARQRRSGQCIPHYHWRPRRDPLGVRLAWHARGCNDTATRTNGRKKKSKIGAALLIRVWSTRYPMSPRPRGFCNSIYFFDPSGHRMEMTARTEQAGALDRFAEAAPAILAEWEGRRRSSALAV